MRVAIYARQSLDRSGDAAGVQRQLEDCRALVVQRGWECVGEFVDNDVSASSRRPRREYERMLGLIRSGEIEALVAWHIDRLTRKLTDLETLIEEAEKRSLAILTVHGDLDLTNDAGRLVGRILTSVSRGEVERKSARQRRAHQQAAERGLPAGGRRAFGYAADGVTLVEDEASAVADGFRALLAGKSLKSIARDWNDRSLRTTAGGEWRHDNVRGVLKNPRYAGLRAYKGEVVGTAVWPAVIDLDTYEATRTLLSLPSRRTTRDTSRKYLLPGLAECWKCGSDVATGHTRHRKRVYVCRARKCVSRKAEPVDRLVEEAVIRRLSRNDVVELLTPARAEELDDLRGRRSVLVKRRDDLALALEEGTLSLPAVRESSARLSDQIRQVEEEIAGALRGSAVAPLAAANDVRGAWSQLSLEQQREVIGALMRITLLPPERGTREFDPTAVRIEWRTLGEQETTSA